MEIDLISYQPTTATALYSDGGIKYVIAYPFTEDFIREIEGNEETNKAAWLGFVQSTESFENMISLVDFLTTKYLEDIETNPCRVVGKKILEQVRKDKGKPPLK